MDGNAEYNEGNRSKMKDDRMQRGNSSGNEPGKETGNPVFRPMNVNDLAAIVEIESLSFTIPWSVNAFYNELTQNQFARYFVVEQDGRVVGYAGMWLIMDEAHITNIAIHPDYRGQKRGEKLLRRLMEEARSHGMRKMTLEVRRSNKVAQNLYEKMGFYATGFRPRYYSDNNEDAMIMWVVLNDAND